jgi:hypothetical protein
MIALANISHSLELMLLISMPCVATAVDAMLAKLDPREFDTKIVRILPASKALSITFLGNSWISIIGSICRPNHQNLIEQ